MIYIADYEKYRASVGITNAEMTRLLREHFPNYSKIQAAMVNSPEKYGVCLTSQAEAAIIAAFGYGEGLNTRQGKKQPAKRKKDNRLVVRLDDSAYQAAMEKMKELGYSSTQDFVEAAIKEKLCR